MSDIHFHIAHPLESEPGGRHISPKPIMRRISR